MSEKYTYYVDVSEGDEHASAYRGPDAADAMASWSRAVTEGREYVALEALRERVAT